MSNANQVLDKIKKELQKPIPSKKKIISYLLDLLNKDKYPSLSDHEFYDIIGETFKLDLKFLMDSVYPDLKKKLQKLYGGEKENEMEIYLFEKFGLYSREQIINRINQEFEYGYPSEEVNSKLFLKSRILTYLYDLQTREEYKSLSNSEFYAVIGCIFKLHPIFFIDFLYGELRRGLGGNKSLEMEKYLIEKFDFVVDSFKLDPKLFMEKIYNPISESLLAIYGYEESWEIIKDIIIYYCLYEGERLLYEFTGDIEMQTSKFNVKIIDGRALLTNNRFIVNGKLKTRSKDKSTSGGDVFWDLIHGAIVSVRRSRRKAIDKADLIDSSTHQKLPCFGYEFPIKNLYGLKKVMSYYINYMVKLNDVNYLLKVSNTRHRDTIFEILSEEIIENSTS